MKFIKTYEEHKQLSLFPDDKDKVQDVAKTFVNKYKVPEFKSTFKIKNVKSTITAKEIIKKYNNRDKFNEIYRNYINNDIDSNDYDFEYCAIQYFIENQ